MVHKRVFVAGSEAHLRRPSRPMAAPASAERDEERPDLFTMVLVAVALVASVIGFSLVEPSPGPAPVQSSSLR